MRTNGVSHLLSPARTSEGPWKALGRLLRVRLRFPAHVPLYKRTMNARHVAALALVGWYLMVPPDVFNQRWTIDQDAPLSKWQMNGSFDSAQNCQREAMLQSEQDRKQARKDRKLVTASDFSAALHSARSDADIGDADFALMSFLTWQQSIYAACIATDDPRLAK